MDIKLLNKVRNRYIKNLKRFNKKVSNSDIDDKLKVNHMIQVYFINKKLKELDEDLKILNSCLINNKKKNQKKQLEKERDEELQEKSINTFKPYILAHYLYSQALVDKNS